MAGICQWGMWACCARFLGFQSLPRRGSQFVGQRPPAGGLPGMYAWGAGAQARAAEGIKSGGGPEGAWMRCTRVRCSAALACALIRRWVAPRTGTSGRPSAQRAPVGASSEPGGWCHSV